MAVPVAMVIHAGHGGSPRVRVLIRLAVVGPREHVLDPKRAWQALA
jgi:hypothetical protein